MDARDRAAVRVFLSRVPDPAPSAEPGLERLSRIVRAFARLPYENLTKILRYSRSHEMSGSARRYPAEVLEDHDRWGSGGTCFSLTFFLARILREAGFAPRIHLADRAYGEAMHSAITVRLEGTAHLVDPGFLLDRPCPLVADRETRIGLPGESVALAPDSGGGFRLDTVHGEHRKFRYRLHERPSSEADFVDRWVESFEWPMMKTLVLCRMSPEGRHYLRDVHYHFVGADGQRQRTLPAGETELLGAAFGVAPELLERARRVLADSSIPERESPRSTATGPGSTGPRLTERTA